LETAPDEVVLEEMARSHAIDAGIFLPFGIIRLRGGKAATEANLTVTLHDIAEPGIRQRPLCLRWAEGSVPNQPPGIQEHTVTEWAALGVASAVVWCYAGLHVRQVTMQGDRFDFWLSDGDQEYGLEVSGTMTEEVEARHRAKVQQLLANPHSADGYVVVVGFATREVIFSFHRFAERVQ
jgi:hypothetical protein